MAKSVEVVKKVLETAERPLSVAEISQIAGIGLTTTYEALKKLKDLDLVEEIGIKPVMYKIKNNGHIPKTPEMTVIETSNNVQIVDHAGDAETENDFQLGKEDIKDVIENIEKNLKFVTKLYIITTDNYSGDYDKIIAHFNEFHKHKVKVINLSEQKAKFEKELRDILVDIVKDIVDFLQSKSISP